MPRYIDQHPTNPNSPPEMATIARQRVVNGRDRFGGRVISVFIGASRTYCYSEAPDGDAVRRAHAAMGITLATEDVSEVQVLP